jgi:LemA protein
MQILSPFFMQTLALGGVVITLLVLAALVALVFFWVMGAYNGLVKLRNRYKNAFAQIDVQLKRRYDLIPNLVETAKKYMSHERETLEAVIAARNSASSARKNVSPDDASNMKSLMASEGALGASLGNLFALSESYPDLKANQNMMQLTEELTSTENKVGFSRQAYNDAVTVYNTKRETFPTNAIAGMFNFGEAILFEVSDASEREAVKVEF